MYMYYVPYACTDYDVLCLCVDMYLDGRYRMYPGIDRSE